MKEINKRTLVDKVLFFIISTVFVITLLYVAISTIWNNKLTQDFKEALEMAQQGDVESQVIVALLYETGRGVETNLTEAAKWYLKAANEGDFMAFLIVCSVDENGDYIYPVTDTIKEKLCMVKGELLF